jgi:glyoxylase-like metal-dependent hydrolase (beta-lactamase superfamily II)
MKRLQRPDLFTWSSYHHPLCIDFNSFLWQRAGGNVLVDPLPLSPEDSAHLDGLGGAAWVLVTNSDHVRGAAEIAARTGARVLGPDGERGSFPLACERWLADGEEPFPGLVVRELEGSKTPRELALVLGETTAIFGDLVRAHRADALMLLPDAKLRDRARALASVRRVRTLHPRIEHVLVGDGWPAFRNGGVLLDELVASG